MRQRKQDVRSLALCLVTVCASTPLFGAGFEVPQRGVKEMGIAFGGSAALLEDASAVGNNPAGLMRLEGRQVSGGVALIRSQFDYDVEVRRELIELEGGNGTVPGKNNGTIRGLSVAPHAYYSQRLSENAAVGIGLYAPFGSTTDYGDQWAGRYHASETNITAVNINPAFAFNLSDTVSVGMGLVIQRFEGQFDSVIDVGYIVADELIKQVDEQVPSTGFCLFGLCLDDLIDVALSSPEEQAVVDALAHNHNVDNEIEVDSWGFGFNAGILWEPSHRTRIGLNYQSAVKHRATGKATRPQTQDPAFEAELREAIEDQLNGIIGVVAGDAGEAGAAQAVGPLGAAGGDLELNVTFPEIATLSFYQGLSERFALTGGATWTNWSRLPEIRFTYTDSSDRGGSDITGSGDDVRRRDLVQPFGWENTWRYGLGLIFTASDRWAFRIGAARDESPVPDAVRRTPRGPDNDRTIGSLGLSWTPSSRYTIDAGYTFTRFDEADIASPENPAGTGHVIDGSYRGRLHTAALQLNVRF